MRNRIEEVSWPTRAELCHQLIFGKLESKRSGDTMPSWMASAYCIDVNQQIKLISAKHIRIITYNRFRFGEPIACEMQRTACGELEQSYFGLRGLNINIIISSNPIDFDFAIAEADDITEQLITLKRDVSIENGILTNAFMGGISTQYISPTQNCVEIFPITILAIAVELFKLEYQELDLTVVRPFLSYDSEIAVRKMSDRAIITSDSGFAILKFSIPTNWLP